MNIIWYNVQNGNIPLINLGSWVKCLLTKDFDGLWIKSEVEGVVRVSRSLD